MKKNYITPNINVVQVDTICSGGSQQASVHEENLSGKCIDQFKVLDQQYTKTNAEYAGLWGESNSKNWGED